MRLRMRKNKKLFSILEIEPLKRLRRLMNRASSGVFGVKKKLKSGMVLIETERIFLLFV
jgi:hypothetical protein